MIRPGGALTLSSSSGKPLPRVDAFRDLYAMGVTPRHGELIMVAGRSGTQKSGFAMFWTSQMNLPTLYFSGDMSAFTASSRIASTRSGMTGEEVEIGMKDQRTRESILASLEDSNVSFSFGAPITWRNISDELEAYVHMHDAYPEVIVVDNLMDIEGADSDYALQMEAMGNLTEIARETGATVIVMHHASDKSWDAKAAPWNPPSRDQIKNGMAEKPELTLTVALDPNNMSYRVAAVKQRSGPCDPSASTFALLRCIPELTRFESMQ